MREKKPAGIILKPTCVTGITGHSSGRGMCVTPIVYQTTTSWFDSDSLLATQRGEPVAAAALVGIDPAGVQLVVAVARGPEVVVDEAGALAYL